MLRLFSFVAIILSTLLACTEPKEPPTQPTYEESVQLLVYKSKVLKNLRVGVAAVLLADQKTGQMELRMNIKNYLEVPLKVDYLQAQLDTKGGARATPNYTEVFPQEIEPDTEVQYVLGFDRPVHSKQFFHQLEYLGDLNASYELKLDFMGFTGQKIKFESDEASYQQYVASFGRESSIKPFGIVNPSKWEQENQACFKELFPEAQSHGATWRNGEWILGGMVGKVNIYQMKDSLVMNIRFANQSSINYSIQPVLLAAKMGDQQLIPQTTQVLLQTRKNPTGNGFLLQKGERFHVKYTFKMPEVGEIELTDFGIRSLPDQLKIPCVPFQSAQSGTGVLGSKSSSM